MVTFKTNDGYDFQTDDISNLWISPLNNGRIGVLTTNPQTQLDVNGTFRANSTATIGALFVGSSTSRNIGTYGFLTNAGNIGTSSGTNNYSIYTNARVACSEINVFSDERIKKDVKNIDKNWSMGVVRKLTPKTFEYIDATKRNNQQTYGFIAQEVENLIPSSVEIKSDIIPNVYALANVQDKKLVFDKPHSLSANDLIKIFTETKEIDTTVESVINDYELEIDSELDVEKCFVYGKSVQDFRLLNYESIWVNSVNAIKYLDSQLTEAMKEIETLNKKMKILMGKLE
jgi:hypothetical protein